MILAYFENKSKHLFCASMLCGLCSAIAYNNDYKGVSTGFTFLFWTTFAFSVEMGSR